MNSLLLFKCLSIESEGKFPNIEKHLDFYDGSFDKAKAKEEGVIVPCKGVSPEYDSSHEEVELVLEELERYLREQRHRLGCQVLCVLTAMEAYNSIAMSCRMLHIGALEEIDSNLKYQYRLSQDKV